MSRVSGASLFLIIVAAIAARADDHVGPEHPRQIEEKPLAFEPPSPAAARVRLANGLTAYLVPDATLPIVRARAYVRAGAAFDPKGKEGLAQLCFRSLRACGAGELKPDAIADRLDRLGATIDGDADLESATVDAWMPAATRRETLAILASVLRRPLFEPTRFAKVKSDLSTEAAAEDDDAAKLATRRLRVRVFGAEHALARSRSGESIEAIERDDVVKLHQETLVPSRVVLAISGAFEPAEMKKTLDELFADWKGDAAAKSESAGKPAVAEIAPPQKTATSGALLIERPVGQATIALARAGVTASDPELAAITIADHIFGSGSFTSRVTARVRSDEGLAYSVGSEVDLPPIAPGLVRIDMATKPSDASFALALAIEECRRFAREGPTDDELAAAKGAVLARLPARFATPHDTARSFAEADLAGLADDSVLRFTRDVAKLDAAAVRHAAARLFDPAGLTIVVIGPLDQVRANRVRGTSIDDLGVVTVER